jgi:hypothetical protein
MACFPANLREPTPGNSAIPKGCHMNMRTALRKLYFPQLSTTVPLPQGGSMEMALPSYLVVTADNRRILIDAGMALTPARPTRRPRETRKTSSNISPNSNFVRRISTRWSVPISTWTTADFTI